MADEFESMENAAARRGRSSRVSQGSEPADPRPSVDWRRRSDDRPPAGRVSGDGARRQRRASATDAGEGWARRFSDGAPGPVGNDVEPRVSTEEEEDAALGRASLLLLHGRFQASVATHIRWNDAPAALYFFLSAFISAGLATPLGALYLLAAALLCANAVVASRAAAQLRAASGAWRQDADGAAHAAASASLVLSVLLTCVCQVVMSLAHLASVVAAPARHSPSDPTPAGCAIAHMGSLQAVGAMRWLRTQLPPRLVVLPEAVRNAVTLAVALAYVAQAHPGGLTLGIAASLTWRAAAITLAVPFAVAACHERNVKTAHMPAALLACPRALVPAVDGLARAAMRAAELLGQGPVLDAPGLSAAVACLATYAALDSLNDTAHALPAVVFRGMAGLLAAAAATVASNRRAGSGVRLTLLQRRLGGAPAAEDARAGSAAAPQRSDESAAASLARRLACAPDEQQAVREALSELLARFPAAAACAIATLPLPPLPPAVRSSVPRYLEVAAARDADRLALRRVLAAALPLSAARAVCSRRGPRMAASFDWAGADAFADWEAVTADGVAPGGQFITVRLSGPGGGALGFFVLVFQAPAALSRDDAHAQDVLHAFATAVGAALGARRAADALAAQARHLSATRRLVAELYPAHIVQRIEARHEGRGAAPARPSVSPTRETERSDSSGGDGDVLVTQHASVTVIYADVVAFQALAKQLSPSTALRLLDALWQRFDALATAHAAYKVETSDDSYTAVTGLSPPRPDHARAALRFALELHAAAAAVVVPLPGWADGLTLRVGLHTGAAASGVLGATRPRFALIGEAASVARRAEAFAAGAVHLSRAVVDACGLPPGALPERLRSGDDAPWCVLQAGSPEAAAVRQMLTDAPAPAAPLSSATDTDSDAEDDDDAMPAWSDEEGGPVTGSSPERSFLAGRRSISPAARRSSRFTTPRRSSMSVSRSSRQSGELPRKEFSMGAQSDAAVAVAADNDDDEAREQRRLRLRTGRFVYAHLATSALAPACFLLWTACGAGGRVRDTAAACVAATALAVLRQRRAIARGDDGASDAALYAPRPLATALWALAALNTVSGVLLLRAAAGGDVATHRRLVRAVSFEPVFSLQWILSGVPARLVWLPELLGSAAQAAALLHSTPEPERTPAAAAAVLLQALCATVFKLLCLPLLYIPTDATIELLAGTETWPRQPGALRHARDACIGAGIRARAAWLRGLPLLGPHGTAILGAHSLILLARMIARGTLYGSEAADAIDAMRFSFLLVCAGGAVVTLRTGAAGALLVQHDDSDAAKTARVLGVLRERIAVARSETAILAAAAEAISALFADHVAAAVGTFAEGSACELLATLEVAGPSRLALASALPLAVGADAGSSVARACAGLPDERPPLLDSRALRGGVGACSDWASAAAAGVPSSRAITAPLTAGSLVVGFVQLHFGLYSVNATRRVDAALARLCDAVGGAIFVRRAFAVNRDAAIGSVAAGLPPRRVASTTALNVDFSLEEDGDDARAASPKRDAGQHYPATAADADALAALDATAEADRATLLNWELNPSTLSDAELRRLCVAMFHTLGLIRRFRLSPLALEAFVVDVAAHMNDVPFHHFRHIVAVAHTAWLFLAESATLRTRLLTEADWLALLLSAMCHDLEHPGTTNAYQINTATALAIRYNDASVLESHHAACGWAVLVRSRLLAPLPAAEVRALRRAMVGAILATDMSTHKTLLAGVEARLAAPPDATGVRISGEDEDGGAMHAGSFSRDSVEDRQLLVSFLLHCADLCNPLLPPALSQRIADDLGREFSAQASLERRAGLPVTVMLADGDASKAKMECGFIDYVVRPLYATLARISPGMGGYCVTRIENNRAAWAALAKMGEPGATPRAPGATPRAPGASPRAFS